MLLPDWLSHRASTTPARPALVADGRTWSFAELDADVTRTARRLAALGVRPGDRVAMLLQNCAGVALLAHAALRLGATLVPLNVRLTDEELSWQLADSRARLLVLHARTANLAARALHALRLPDIRRPSTDGPDSRRPTPESSLLPPDPPRVVSLDAEGAAAAGGVLLEEQPEAEAALRLAHDPDAVLALIYTSGTTGRPKGAMLTVGNFWWSAAGSALNLGIRVDDRWLACMPLFHVGGLSIVVRSAIYGTTADVHDGFDVERVNRAIDEEGVTIVSVVAVMLQRMLDARGDRPYPPSLRCVLLGGGPAPRPLLERCAAIGIPVVQTYGLTETTSQVATLAPEDALRRLGAAGKPLYPNELRIVTSDGHDAAPGEPGEILVRGPVVMAGYAGRPGATARAVVDGWLHTGDIGSLDAEGYLHVHDRRDDLIVTGGENVYPAEVEAALLAHPWVAEAGVIGLPDPTWGQRVVAVVRLAESAGAAAGGATAELLRAHCRSRLGGYKVPSEVRLVADALPRTASGKLQRGLLRERAGASAG